jgi:hypothetical protein
VLGLRTRAEDHQRSGCCMEHVNKHEHDISLVHRCEWCVLGTVRMA